MKKKAHWLFAVVLGSFLLCSCGGKEVDKQEDTKTEETTIDIASLPSVTLTLDEKKVYQTIEGFGASGAWWSQDIGGWTDEYTTGETIRDHIATLLFDKEDGIGLNTYRYNIGAGSSDEGAQSVLSDTWRKAESFETAPGVYDWTRDENAVWFLKKAVESGVTDVVLFCNSPLERLTVSGKAYGNAKAESFSNITAENYEAFAKYVLDVTEHFVEEGIPVKFVSPINEPQWEWTGGQEGCHYEPEEMAAALKVFVKAIGERKSLQNIEISAPELGEWGNTSIKYFNKLFEDDMLADYFTSLDVHSYWTESGTKGITKNILDKLKSGLILRTSEWCEMTNGRDYTMDSALELSKVMNDDLTILNVSSWQYWIAVSCYSYRDGLIYVNKGSKTLAETKRLWAMGNYSRFIHAGYKRVDLESSDKTLGVSAYMGQDEQSKKDELVVVITNEKDKQKLISLDFADGYKDYSIYVTDENSNLECIESDEIKDDSKVLINAESVTTIILTK